MIPYDGSLLERKSRMDATRTPGAGRRFRKAAPRGPSRKTMASSPEREVDVDCTPQVSRLRQSFFDYANRPVLVQFRANPVAASAAALFSAGPGCKPLLTETLALGRVRGKTQELFPYRMLWVFQGVCTPLFRRPGANLFRRAWASILSPGSPCPRTPRRGSRCGGRSSAVLPRGRC